MDFTFINHNATPSDIRSRKRRRIAQACLLCRERKVKCDGVQPVCGACQKDPTRVCKYPTPRKASGEECHSSLSILAGAADAAGPLSRKKGVTNEEAGAISSAITESEAISNAIDNTNDINDTIDEEDVPDAMCTKMTVHDKDGPNSDFGSSSYKFIDQLTNRILSIYNGSLQQPHIRMNDSPHAAKSSRKIHKLPLGDINLPSRRLADELVSLYFLYTHIIYPFVHKHSFMKTYEAIWSGDYDLESHPYFYVTLNMVFAFGGHFSNELAFEKRNEALRVYFERAKKALHLDSLEAFAPPVDLELVQALVITCQYLQETEQLDLCWSLMGLTIRLAQSLGLHVDVDSNECEDMIELEMRRRLWYGCFLLDRLLGLTLGRPAMIWQTTSVTLPSVVDDELIYETHIECQPENRPSLMTFFIVTIELFQTLDYAELDLYSKDLSGSWFKLVDNAFKHLKALSDWKAQVPWFLQAFSTTNNLSSLDNRIQGQARILFARYLHVQIIVLRTCMLRLLTSQPHRKARSSLSAETNSVPLQGLSTEFLQKASSIWDEHDSWVTSASIMFSKMCAKSAMLLPELVYFNTKDSNGPISPICWFNLFYIYTSAVVLTIVRLIPSVWKDMDESAVENSWALIMRVTESLEKRSKTAALYRNLLIRIRSKVMMIISSEPGQVVQSGQAIPSSTLPYNVSDCLTQDGTSSNNNDLGDSNLNISEDDMKWLQSISFFGLPFFDDIITD
ncbi:fungal-specific transcription factor domain-containing protein [Dipodascopsis uninucleata]